MSRPALPNSYVVFKDGQLPKGPLSSGLPIFIGPGVGSAPANTLVPVNSPNDVVSLFGVGPLARDVSTFFMSGGNFCYALRLNEDTAGSIGTVTVGSFTGLTAGGVSHGEFDVRGRCVVAGTLGQAQVVFSLDGGRTWGAPQVLVAGANQVKGLGGFLPGLTVTPTAMSYTVDPNDLSASSSSEFRFKTVAPQATVANIKLALDALIQNPGLFFNLVHISYQAADAAATIVYAGDIAAKMLDAEQNWDRYIWAVIQAPIPADSTAAITAAQTIRAGFANKRVQLVIQPLIVKSLGGQFVMNPSAVAVARRMSLAPQNDLGLVAAGQLISVVDFAPGWTQAGVIGLDAVQNSITFRKIFGAAGIYPTNGWMTDPSSDYSMDKFRLIADLCAADVRTAGVGFIKMDIDPDDPERSAQPLIDSCKTPLLQRVNSRPPQLSGVEVTIPPGQDILTTKTLIVEVALKPIGSADWIQFNLGFKSPFTGG